MKVRLLFSFSLSLALSFFQDYFVFLFSVFFHPSLLLCFTSSCIRKQVFRKMGADMLSSPAASRCGQGSTDLLFFETNSTRGLE